MKGIAQSDPYLLHEIMTNAAPDLELIEERLPGDRRCVGKSGDKLQY